MTAETHLDRWVPYFHHFVHSIRDARVLRLAAMHHGVSCCRDLVDVECREEDGAFAGGDRPDLEMMRYAQGHLIQWVRRRFDHDCTRHHHSFERVDRYRVVDFEGREASLCRKRLDTVSRALSRGSTRLNGLR